MPGFGQSGTSRICFLSWSYDACGCGFALANRGLPPGSILSQGRGATGMEARHFIVRGRVQGVGFRFFAEREARRAGVHGWVRNRADGAVETLAIGERGALENFRRRLEQGPP